MAGISIDLTGKVAMVTGSGAGGGIGHAIAVGLARAGADLVAVDLDLAGAEATASEARQLGRRALAVVCDMGSEEQLVAAFARVDEEFGRIDILVNNAGVLSHEHPEEMPLVSWNKVIAVNLTGYFLACREAGSRMIRQGWGGSIINISSVNGTLAMGRGNAAYSASKGAVNQLTRELALEWAHHGIRVNAIQPANVRTPALQRVMDDPNFDSDKLIARFLQGIPMNRLGEPEDMAGAAVFLASDLAGWITGILLPVDGGNLAMNPSGSKLWPAE